MQILPIELRWGGFKSTNENGRWYCYQRPLRLMVEVLGPKAILSDIWRQVPQLGPKALLVPLMHFRYPSRRCFSCD